MLVFFSLILSSYNSSVVRVFFLFLLASSFILLREEISLGTVVKSYVLAWNWPVQLNFFLPCGDGNREGWPNVPVKLFAISLKTWAALVCPST